MTLPKKTYIEPKLIIHGDVEQLTQNGHKRNADLPRGHHHAAFSPG